jgi:hypothetical protein
MLLPSRVHSRGELYIVKRIYARAYLASLPKEFEIEAAAVTYNPLNSLLFWLASM